MRMLVVIAVGLFLMSAGQLCAQQDPFGEFVSGEAARRVVPADRQPTLDPAGSVPDETVQHAVSQPVALYPHVRVGRRAAAEERIENALNRETSFDYLDQPLMDVVEDIAFNNSIPIIIDTGALEDFAIDTATPIVRSVKGVSLRSALRLILRDLELTYVIRDEVLRITTREVADSAPSTRFYHVAELLPPDGDGKVLVELIKTLVAPQTWCGSDAVGSISYVEHLESLAIRQTDEVFHEIEELLATTKQLAQNQRPKVLPHERDPFD